MTETTPPRAFAESIGRVRETIRGATRLLVCLDFDGTLAPIVDAPNAARPTPENQAAVEALASEPRVTTAVVSGRALSDVRDRIDGPSIYAGNHGLELERYDSTVVHPVARKRADRLETVCSLLERTVETIPNCRVENKRLTGTVHFRSVPDPLWPLVRRRTREVVDRHGESLELSTGKRILEIEPDFDWGKGNAVELIAADLPAETVPIYVGDDVTDESAFEAVEPDGVGVRVGDASPSAASVRVATPDEVASLLDWLGSTAVPLLNRPSEATSPTDPSLPPEPVGLGGE